MKREMFYWLLLFVAICMVVVFVMPGCDVSIPVILDPLAEPAVDEEVPTPDNCDPADRRCETEDVSAEKQLVDFLDDQWAEMFGDSNDEYCSANGVLTNERVVDLPQDQTKWYISVVGTNDSEHYERLLAWFDTDKNLAKLKSQVHFRPIDTDTVIFSDRYEPNITGLPTVRMQEADGTVVYEAAGKYIPLTAGGLYGAMVNSTFTSRGIRPVLPWRREMENRCPYPTPTPGPDADPAPQPLDDGGPPNEVDTGPSIVLLVFLGFLCFSVGFAVGIFVKWKQESQLK